MSPFKRIETGTPEGDALGFTEDLFSGWIELDEQHKRIYLHYIISRKKNEGNVQKLILSWLKSRYEIRVVMPKEIMKHILTKQRISFAAGGFTPRLQFFPDQYTNPVEIWVSRNRTPLPIRDCFCPYIDAPHICGSSIPHGLDWKCEQPHEKGREDCPIIKYRGDL